MPVGDRQVRDEVVDQSPRHFLPSQLGREQQRRVARRRRRFDHLAQLVTPHGLFAAVEVMPRVVRDHLPAGEGSGSVRLRVLRLTGGWG